jgi:hypothetical protein
MKKNTFFLLIIFTFLINSCKKEQSISDPKIYNDTLAKIFYSVQYPMDSLQMHLFSMKYNFECNRQKPVTDTLIKPKILAKRLKKAQVALKKAKKLVYKIDYQKKDPYLKKSILESFETLDSTINYAIIPLINLVKKMKGSTGQQVLDSINHLGKETYRMYTKAIKEAQDGQRNFDIFNSYILEKNFISPHF